MAMIRAETICIVVVKIAKNDKTRNSSSNSNSNRNSNRNSNSNSSNNNLFIISIINIIIITAQMMQYSCLDPQFASDFESNPQ